MRRSETVGMFALICAIAGTFVFRVNHILVGVTERVESEHTNKASHSIPSVLSTDIIMEPFHARSVFVIPEYKLIYITFPKVACSEWKRMFMRINHNPKWCTTRNAHSPTENEIKTLADYPLEIATAMMTSPAWTRATVVREPKERLLSAFLDKCVKERYFEEKCCRRLPDTNLQNRCIENQKELDNFLYFITNHPEECFDVHWDLITNKVDEKFWPYIDFIGHQDNLIQDAQTLLKRLTSQQDEVYGRSLWDRYGSSGWGSMKGCENRTNAFLQENTSAHNIDTGSQMKEWYTPETEKLAEQYLAKEWQQPKIKHPLVKLFP